MRKLKRDKPHYSVTGHVGAVFEQDGVLFDDAGDEVVEVEGANVPVGDQGELTEELGQLRDQLEQKNGEVAELIEKLDKALQDVERLEAADAELKRNLNKADEGYELEVSRADGLQAKVTELEAKIAELETKLADAAFPALPGKDKVK